MRWFAPLVAAMLIYAMTPGLAEAAENLVHLVSHGDTAHGGEHADEADGGGQRDAGEHGCSGPFHACGCHGSVAFVAGQSQVRLAPAPRPALAVPTTCAPRDSGVIRDVDRPPRP